ncbi:MAG: hypothetical protein AMJ62_01195, partial [Myxococcales bacterium SG8_38]
MTALPARDPNPVAKAVSLAYLTFRCPDLDREEAFLVDFGLRTVRRSVDALYMRDSGSSPFC